MVAYRYSNAIYLGLGMPALAIRNAENYAIFALCVQYPTLDCLGTYASSIAKREEVPFQPAPETVMSIQQEVRLFHWGLVRSGNSTSIVRD